MKRMEVRCCCTPNKLLGTLPVPDATDLGDAVRFALMKPRSRALAAIKASASVKLPPMKSVTMPVKVILFPPTGADPGDAYEALAAEGVTIEQLRLIPGFIEATP